MNIYVGNLSYDTTAEQLRTAFSAYGEIDSVRMVTDRDTGRPKGFGFVEMSNNAQAQAAIDGLNGKELDGRQIKVNEARPREEGGSRGGGYRSGGGGGGRGRW